MGTQFPGLRGSDYLAIPRKVITRRSSSTICRLDSRPIRTCTLLRRTVVNLSTMSSLFGTPVILLVVSGGQLSHGVGLGLERLALTAAAGGLAVAAAAVMEHHERRSTASTQPTA